MRLAQHLTFRFALGASNVCLVGEARRAPSRHYKDARVNGRTTTAMNDNEYPPLPPPPPLKCLLYRSCIIPLHILLT